MQQPLDFYILKTFYPLKDDRLCSVNTRAMCGILLTEILLEGWITK